MEDAKTFILTIVMVFFLFMALYGRYLVVRLKKGKLKGLQLVEVTSSMVIQLFKKEGRNWKLKLDSVSSIDEKLNELMVQHDAGYIKNNTNLAFEMGCFLGQILRYRLGAKWLKKEEEKYPITMQLKDKRLIHPFQVIEEKLRTGDPSYLRNFSLSLKKK